jgi:hypothetical protein
VEASSHRDGRRRGRPLLTSLATEAKVAASTQNQALNALLFLYRVVLEQDLPWLNEVVRARRPQHLPVVLSREEVRGSWIAWTARPA